MKDQHKKIKGYRDLTQEEIDLMDEIKDLGVKVGDLIKKINWYNKQPSKENEGIVNDSEAFRWESIARTDLQKGFMALTRSVEKPGFF